MFPDMATGSFPRKADVVPLKAARSKPPAPRLGKAWGREDELHRAALVEALHTHRGGYLPADEHVLDRAIEFSRAERAYRDAAYGASEAGDMKLFDRMLNRAEAQARGYLSCLSQLGLAGWRKSRKVTEGAVARRSGGAQAGSRPPPPARSEAPPAARSGSCKPRRPGWLYSPIVDETPEERAAAWERLIGGPET